MSDEHPKAPQESGQPSTVPTRESPLRASHVDQGAVFTCFAGWRMPLRYRSELSEHHAVRKRAAVFDLSHMAEIEVAGPGAADALDFALVGHLSALAVGGARYSMICNPAGGILDDLVVYRTRVDRFLVVANAANASTVYAELAERSAGHRADVVDATDRYGLIAIQGPRALGALRRLTSASIDDVAYYSEREAEVDGVTAMVARTGYTGEDGFELFVPAADAARVFEALLEAGRGEEIIPAGLAARDSLRLEAGMPLYGNELSSEVTPYEVGLGRVVRLEKPGDFVGRSALERRKNEGAALQLVGLLGDGRRAPRHGYRVLDATTGEVLGTVTSGALSPTLERPIAMALLPHEAVTAERELVVDVRGQNLHVELTQLPFYKRARDRADR